eukprot:Seg1568.2 transcript_id=Seg1568.2/GoldUCD/mRNA.D3Y31 product="hypothetical protein" protein_id=Seg1568.2/GoldUCD/D3Y31
MDSNNASRTSAPALDESSFSRVSNLGPLRCEDSSSTRNHLTQLEKICSLAKQDLLKKNEDNSLPHGRPRKFDRMYQEGDKDGCSDEDRRAVGCTLPFLR